MKKIKSSQLNITELLLMLLAFSMPLNRFSSNCILILIVIHWLFSSGFRSKLRNFLHTPMGWTLPLLYICYTVGIFYSKNTAAALFDLQVKLPLLIFPLILLSYGKKIDIDNVIIGLTVGLLCAFIVFMTVGMIRNFQMHQTFSYLNPWFFTYNLFSNPLSMQPNYIAMYICVALAFCFREFFINSKMNIRIIYAMIILILLFFIILLSSRTQWIALLLIILSGFFMIKMKKKELIMAVLVFIVGFVSSVFIIINNEVNKQHFSETFIQGKHENPAFSGRENRKMIWTSALVLIGESPFFGKGNGDVKDELIRIYHEKGFDEGITNQLNAHNEFLQTAISSGIPAMMLLLFILVSLIFAALRKKDFIGFAFGLTVLSGMITESLLNRQNGVFFMALFLSLLLIRSAQPLYKED